MAEEQREYPAADSPALADGPGGDGPARRPEGRRAPRRWRWSPPASIRPHPPPQPQEYQHPAPSLVAADTALASRWFTADPAPGRLIGRTVVLPFVALAELATWPERLLWGHSRTEDLSRWTDPSRMILGDDTVARIWARITVAAQRAGSEPSLNDAWIAAGCLSYGLPLATLTKRRYRYFADRYGLELI